ncbi:copper homeostasis protein CutC [Stackebrandtia nassauensis]|uniref:Copper homeostasis protein cutC homolog n=1 Tax=Stackebrandtia nassauensis (strain DSM 44728 / CIP 108903 / NRRL B-16338 / NBRC 102104 / LLR-40K-21) TaxID=446470 RepID=D3Q1G4_STANL|nr:copper homeostasis protein CutC [Stackebrandtia nassauensis]ADD45744.1 CutC family protein [Stackebrandtia nassauensis DSM 44728]
MPTPLLEVIALDAADARAAAAGGADRLELVTNMAADGLTPSLRTVAAIRAVCDIQLRVMLRLREDFAPTDLDELARLATKLAEAGADGFVLGFLGADGTIDLDSTRQLARAVGLPWTCHRVVDHTRDHAEAMAAVRSLPGLDQVLTAGHPDGVSSGMDNLRAAVSLVPVMAGGGLRPSQVPILRDCGVNAFHIGSAARPNWASPVSARQVAKWRELVNDCDTTVTS